MNLNLNFSQNEKKLDSSFVERKQIFGAGFSDMQVLHDGQNGATFIPSVSPDGIISWENDRELPNPSPVNIKGEKGVDGENGFSPTVSVEQIEGGNRVSITDKDGTQSFDVMNGVGGEGGGVTSWNDLTDKPFGTEIVEGVITFDGDYSKYEYVDMGAGYLVRVSDKVLTVDDLVGATIRIVQPSTSRFEDHILTEALIVPAEVLGIPSVYGAQVSVVGGIDILSLGGDLSSLASMGIPITKEGTYFSCVTDLDEGWYVESVSCLTGQVETVKPLDEKYIPDTIARVEDIPTIEEFISALPIYNGEVEEV